MGGHLVPMNRTCLSLSITSTKSGFSRIICWRLVIVHSHTGENLATELEDMLKAWNLSVAQLSAATTDNAANIVLAMEMLGWGHFRCFSHSLQLAINQAFEIQQVSRALARARNLVTHFHHSPRSTHLLKEKQGDLKHPSHSLVQQVATRWNSAYYMLQRILEQQQPLCATLLEL